MSLRIEGGRLLLRWICRVGISEDFDNGIAQEERKNSRHWVRATIEEKKGSMAELVIASSVAGEEADRGLGIAGLRISAKELTERREVGETIWEVVCEADLENPEVFLRDADDRMRRVWGEGLLSETLESAAFELFQASSGRTYSPMDAGFLYLSAPKDEEERLSDIAEARALLESIKIGNETREGIGAAKRKRL